MHLLGEPGYPVELSGDHEAPAVCFVLGDASKLASRRQGRRDRHSVRDRAWASRWRSGSATISPRPACRVVSGLARGIDGAAHLGALRRRTAAPPIGVVGSGLDVAVPASERGLWSAVAERGRPAVRGAAGRAAVRVALPRAQSHDRRARRSSWS